MKTIFKGLIMTLLLVPALLAAQTTVKGTVTEQSTGSPLPDVNVVVKGTSNGTLTDFDGNYEIKANQGDVLVFSYLGFLTQEVAYEGADLNVSLVEDASQLDEVVVIGYGSVKKKDLTGATDLVTAKDFNKGPMLSAQQLIAGKVAGVSITSGSGAPGDGQNINIRGLSSLSLTNQPLFVIDGLPIDNNGVGGSRNPLNTINPNDIESLVVLKDASATAIYGSRAANGVILITTKKGKSSDWRFNLNTSATIHSVTDKVDVMTADEFRGVINGTGDAAAIARLGDANTNWQDQIYDDSGGNDHSFSATGKIGEVPVRASLGYSYHDGILRRDNFNRTTASLNLTPKLLNDALKIELNARGSYTENHFANRGAIGSANGFDPTQPVFGQGSPFSYSGWYADPDMNGIFTQLNLAPTNPVALIDLIDDTAEVRRFIGNAKFDYDLPFLKNVTATLNVGLDQSDSNGRTITSANLPISEENYNGARTEFSQNSKNELLDAYLTYNNTFNDVHSLTVVGGYSYQSFEFEGDSFDSEAQEDGNDFEFVDKSESVLLSYFGRVNYDYAGKYLLTATVRADASSKLNPDDRWGIFPSAAFAWNISNEDFMKDNNFFNELKLRVGYGEVGNVNGLADYRFLTRYTGSQSTANYQFGNAFLQTFRPEPVNEDIRWEIGRTLNFGIDYSIFNRRFFGSINVYTKETEDLIAFTLVDPFTNFGNRIDANIGDMENKGVELTFNVIPVKTDNFEWSINYNIAFNDNEITNMPDQQFVGGISGGVGNNIQTHVEGEAPYSFLVYEQVYDNAGRPIEGVYVDQNGDNIINDADRYIKESPYADVIMGLNMNMNYKGWDFSFQSRANFGNYAYNNVASSTGYLTRATENNILSNLHADYFNTGFNNITETNLLSDHYIQEASFFKIDNISLGHTFDKAIDNTRVRVYGSLQNVATITDYDGLDPEITGGIDNNFYPRPRSFVFGLNIDF